MAQSYQIPGVYSRPRARAEGFPRVRTDIAGFVGIAGPRHVGEAVAVDDWQGYVAQFRTDERGEAVPPPAARRWTRRCATTSPMAAGGCGS